MTRPILSAVAVIAAFVTGLVTAPREASAAGEPASCSAYQCKEVHAYWPAGSAVVVAYFTHPASGHGAQTTMAKTDIFTPGSTWENPASNDTGVFVDHYDYPSCTPKCGIDPGNLKWQGPQEVVKGGTEITDSESLNNQRRKCTATEGGANGALAANQNNQNTGDAKPPGN